MRAVVIDTNVPVVANGNQPVAEPTCVLTCITALRQARHQVILLDEGSLILREYRYNLSPKGEPGLGDAFFKWLWDNQYNPARCRLVKLTPLDASGTNFEEFPADPELEQFDRSDRKFVAMALGSRLDPEILNAVDTDWWDFNDALSRHGVRVNFLCPDFVRSHSKVNREP